MAYDRNNAQRNTRNDTRSNDESWKAQGFLNLYLPTPDGKRRKLAGIPLKDSKPAEAKMLDWLNADPSRVGIIMSKLVIEYQSATPADTSGFDLSEGSADGESIPS